jgi:hypothetical protein
MEKSVVHIVHCIDTEGPLYESLSATFERLKEIFGIEIEPSSANLRKLQNKEIDLGGKEGDVAKVVDPKLLSYNDSWDKVDNMLSKIMSHEYRNTVKDSFGNGWVYNWFCMDHVGFKINPRRRDIGFHNIYDHYLEIIKNTKSVQDGIHFHHHPVPFTEEAHHPATHLFSHTPVIYEILARRIIERQWFSCVSRPGFHSTRPDSHWFLEQFIPFDYANQATGEDYSAYKDLSGGRFGDWRRAPKTWTPYHPDHDDYQKEGNCRRLIARTLNVGTRSRLICEQDIEHAFVEASEGKPVVLSFTHHDYRDIEPDINYIRDMIACVAKKHPEIQFSFCEARDAFRKALRLEECEPVKFKIEWDKNRLQITADNPIYGPQPFLAIKTKCGRFYHDNLDFQVPFTEWSYVFDDITLQLSSIDVIGIGACDATGNVTVALIYPETNKIVQTCY